MPDRILYGDYHLLGRLNTGGMAEVFLGRRVDAPVDSDLLAIKRMLPRFSQDEEFSTMFQDEAKIAAQLNHPNICRVYDEGTHQNQLFIVMEFVHGKDMKVVHLRARERGERLPHTLVAFVLAEIADALAHAHNLTNDAGEPENLVHRDVSPQNILVGYDGVPKLIDFGVARAKSRAAQTKVGIVKGKFAYMSPEQAMAKPLDGRSDVWALGVVFYQLLTGELPFRGGGDLEMLRRIAAGQATPITDVAPETPLAIVEILGRAMSADREKRYQSAAQFAEECRAFADSGKHPVDSSSVAAYMRRLFKREYARESNRIRRYQEGADAASLRRERLKRGPDDLRALDSETLSLAAGYRGELTDDKVIELDDADVRIEERGVDPGAEAKDTDTPSETNADGRAQLSTDNAPRVGSNDTPTPTHLEEEITDQNPQPPIGGHGGPALNDPTTQAGFPRNTSGQNRGAPAQVPRILEPPEASRSGSPRGTSTTIRGITQRRVLLTTRQLFVLLVAATLGLGAVAGAFLYAQAVPLP